MLQGSGEAAGTVQGASGGWALGYVKLKAVLGGQGSGEQGGSNSPVLVGSQSGAELVAVRPEWWPSEWGMHEEATADNNAEPSSERSSVPQRL